MLRHFLPPAVLSVGLLFSSCTDKAATARKAAAAAPSTQAVEVVLVEHRDLIETLSLVGSVAPNESAHIRAEIAGLVREIFFDEGEKVEKGKLLLKIDDTELVAQTAQAEAGYSLADLNLQRNEALVKSQNAKQSDLDRARSEFNTAKAQLALLRNRLQKTEIRAPFDGIIGARTISPGDYVTSQSSITTIDDLARLKINFEVPEKFLRKIKSGTKFSVKSRAMDIEKPIQGEVYFVSSIINRDTRASDVKGYLTNPPTELKPGMFANVEVIMDVRKGVLTVPEGSIFNSTKGPQVIVVREKGGDKVADFVPIEMGLRSKGFVEITPRKAGAITEKQSVVASGVGAVALYQDAKLDPQPLRKEFQVGSNN
jgi:membrane fusion protein (multidrug efflux system)